MIFGFFKGLLLEKSEENRKSFQQMYTLLKKNT